MKNNAKLQECCINIVRYCVSALIKPFQSNKNIYSNFGDDLLGHDINCLLKMINYAIIDIAAAFGYDLYIIWVTGMGLVPGQTAEIQRSTE